MVLEEQEASLTEFSIIKIRAQRGLLTALLSEMLSGRSR